MTRPITISSSPNCVATIESKADCFSLKIAGWINEDVNFAKILEVFSIGNVRALAFDLLEVTQINSCGVREWLLFLEKISPTIKIRFDAVGETFIEQANIIPNLLGKPGTEVRVIQVPYFCPTCQKRVIKPMTPTSVTSVDDNFLAPKSQCPGCSGHLEFDGIEDEYFNFLRHAKG